MTSERLNPGAHNMPPSRSVSERMRGLVRALFGDELQYLIETDGSKVIPLPPTGPLPYLELFITACYVDDDSGDDVTFGLSIFSKARDSLVEYRVYPEGLLTQYESGDPQTIESNVDHTITWLEGIARKGHLGMQARKWAETLEEMPEVKIVHQRFMNLVAELANIPNPEAYEGGEQFTGKYKVIGDTGPIPYTAIQFKQFGVSDATIEFIGPPDSGGSDEEYYTVYVNGDGSVHTGDCLLPEVNHSNAYRTLTWLEQAAKEGRLVLEGPGRVFSV